MRPHTETTRHSAEWMLCGEFHGHFCPGLAIGYRAVEAARQHLGASRPEDEELVCVTENDACGVDAIQLLLSCTVGKGNLVFRPTGKMAFTFFDRDAGAAMRVYFKAERNEADSREEWQERLLTLPLDEVFSFSEPRFEPPERARLFSGIACARCGERAPDHRVRVLDGGCVCLDCFPVYDRGWFGR